MNNKNTKSTVICIDEFSPAVVKYLKRASKKYKVKVERVVADLLKLAVATKWEPSLSIIEEYEDIQTALSRMDEPTVPWSEVKKKLLKRGHKKRKAK